MQQKHKQQIRKLEMVKIKEFINQELENLNEEQLRQIVDFIAFIKFRARFLIGTPSESQMAALYSEFADEDQRLAEEGVDEYAEILRKEDLQ